MAEIAIREAILNDCEEIANLHRKYIATGFLSSTGKSFLKLLYQSLIVSSHTFCVVAEENGKVIGFVSGAVELKQFYKEFIKKNLLRACILLLPKLVNPKIAIKIFETLLYPTKKAKYPIDAELLSIVVDNSYSNRSIGRKLFEEIVKGFQSRNVRQFKVVAGVNLIAACRFYEKMGGILSSEIELHKGEKSKVYVWKI